ncbi:MAG TPA: flagellar M-ring protein FliF C-terminal domain-containing protein, partial [Pirellulaceae bacterium]|nr:flagellar M-ring protein FliF C-terminal domain-containing protein [Pirellulaceae bacterium]
MDFLNKALAQISDLFRSMTPGARITAALLLVAIVVSVFFLFQQQTSSGDEYLLGGREFSNAEIAQAEAAFAKESLAKSEVIGNKIKIPRGQKAAYLAALGSNNALPSDFGTALTNAAASENPFMSSKSLDIRLQAAKQKELSLIISRMRGVEVATVTFDEIDKPGFPRRKEKSAMVAVKPVLGAELSGEQIRAIRNTVAAAYAGLDRNNVTVTDMEGSRSYSGAGSDGLGGADDNLYAEAKQRYERDWQTKIYDRLRMIPGVVVGVNVDLDPDILHQTNSHKLDPKAVAVEVSESSEISNSTLPTTGGRPGTVPNSMVNAPAAVSQEKGGQSSRERNDAKQASLVGQDHITSRRAPLTPKQVQVVVDVPMSYYRRIWNERNPTPLGQEAKPPAPADLDKIEVETRKRVEDTVVKLLPRPETGNDPFMPVVVTSFQDLAQTPLVPPSTVDNATTWLAANWQTVGMVILGLFSLMMLRGMVRGSTAQL